MTAESRQPLIFDIHRYALDDGPGIRTTIFFKGCPLACLWCHNREGQLPGPELFRYDQRCIGCGDCASVCPRGAIAHDNTSEIDRNRCDACGICADRCPAKALEIKGHFYPIGTLVSRLLKDKRFYINSGGGITLSGGEPTLCPDYLHALIRELKHHGLHVALQTCGHFEWKMFEERLLPWLDLIYFDLKCADDRLHRQWTGRSNRRILTNFSNLARGAKKKLICTIPLIDGWTAARENLELLACRIGAVAGLAYRLHPYHPGAHWKADALGRPAPAGLPLHPMTPERYSDIRSRFERMVNETAMNKPITQRLL